MQDNGLNEKTRFFKPPQENHASQNGGAQGYGYDEGTTKNGDGRPHSQSVPMFMNRYRVIKELGRGGMGMVYHCFDEVGKIEVALKTLPPELSHNQTEMEDVRDNFQIVHKLSHSNIAAVHQIEKDPATGDCYIIMEYVNGKELRSWMRERRKDARTIPLPDALSVLRQLAAALDYAHGKNVIHRDIKPANIMLTMENEVKLLDFGLAAQLHSSLSSVSMAVTGRAGTAAYMSPEQMSGKRQKATADQYALAVVAYEMLSGYRPFDCPDFEMLKSAVLNDAPEPVEGLPAHVWEALKKALAKKPEDRFGSCKEFVDALEGERPVSPKSSHAALEDSQLMQKVYIHKATLDAYNGQLVRSPLDRAQTFGEHIQAFKDNYASADAVMQDANNPERYVLALAWYEAAAEEAKWLTDNTPERETARKLLADADAARAQAVKDGAETLGKVFFEAASASLGQAKTDFEAGKFDSAQDQAKSAVNAFAEAGKQAVRSRVASHLAAGRMALAAKQWDDAAARAQETLKLEPDNAEAKRLMADVEKNRRPAVTVYAQLDGETVAATIDQFTPSHSGKAENGAFLLEKGKSYDLHLTYQKDGNTYVGSLAFTADWNGHRQKTVALKNSFTGIITLPGNVQLEMVKIQAGSFQMGSPESEKDRFRDEPLHGVTLTQDYWLGKYEVTQEQYEAVMKDNPSYFKKGGRYPVEQVTWDKAMKFCEKLNSLMKGKLPSGYEFNLPTEAQWEYACRAGTTTPFSFGTELNGREANCNGNFPYGTIQEGPYLEKTSPVGSYRANAWGLYDMHGNVWEWCRDWYESNYADDPEYLRGQKKGTCRVNRGGSWYNCAGNCRSAFRFYYEPSFCYDYLGFRLALVPVP